MNTSTAISNSSFLTYKQIHFAYFITTLVWSYIILFQISKFIDVTPNNIKLNITKNNLLHHKLSVFMMGPKLYMCTYPTYPDTMSLISYLR